MFSFFYKKKKKKKKNAKVLGCEKCANAAKGSGKATLELEGKKKERKRKKKYRCFEETQERGLPELNVRMGLTTGTCLAGNVGSKLRMKYTLLGDSVNLAARLEVWLGVMMIVGILFTNSFCS